MRHQNKIVARCYSVTVVEWSIVIRVSVCLFVCARASISRKLHDLSSTHRVTPGRISVFSDGAAIRYVLPSPHLKRQLDRFIVRKQRQTHRQLDHATSFLTYSRNFLSDVNNDKLNF